MNVIDSYLDTLFSPYPDSPRLREARTELRAMMEDKQQALLAEGHSESQAVGKVIAEFGSLEEVAPVLGIDAELHGAPAGTADGPPSVDLERAQQYVTAVRRTQWMPAIAIPLFVLSAVPLLVLIALGGRVTPEPAPWATGVGLVTLLVTVGAGVLLLVLREARLGEFEDLENDEATPSAQARRYAVDLRREHKSRTSLAFGVAIMLWILCAVPTILAGLSVPPGSVAPLYGVSLTLVIVALGLWIILRVGWVDQAAGHLLGESDEEDMPENSSNTAVRVVAALYWPVIAAIYLAWSFFAEAWGISWVVWPVAGVLYVGLWSLNAALVRTPENPAVRTGRA